jgi:hypothetical protein
MATNHDDKNHEKELKILQGRMLIRSESPRCKVFGCGKILSLQEQLFGDRCVDHGKKVKNCTDKQP